MEAIPLVMEPESTMYSDPVIVLDYQSLYPSQIIAYNLCFCTCLGRPMHAADPSQALRLGASTLCLPHGTLQGDLDPSKYDPLAAIDPATTDLFTESPRSHPLYTKGPYICCRSHECTLGAPFQVTLLIGYKIRGWI